MTFVEACWLLTVDFMQSNKQNRFFYRWLPKWRDFLLFTRSLPLNAFHLFICLFCSTCYPCDAVRQNLLSILTVGERKEIKSINEIYF